MDITHYGACHFFTLTRSSWHYKTWWVWLASWSSLKVAHHMSFLRTVGIQVVIFFLVEWYKILLLSNKAALSLDSVILLLFIYDLVTSDWLIYCFYFSCLWLAILQMGKSKYLLTICRCPTRIGNPSPPNHPTRTMTQLSAAEVSCMIGESTYGFIAHTSQVEIT